MDYIQTLKDLENYYTNLLIVQYNGLKKAKSTIELMTWLIYSKVLLLQIRDSFDWRTATGKQLDIIGEWVGVSRAYNGSLFWGDTYLSYPAQDDLVPDDNTDALQHGYSDYATFETDTGNVLTYNGMQFVTQDLSDDDYRLLIGLKIIKNSINHTAKYIDDAIFQYFGGKELYSKTALTVGMPLYKDKELTDKYGEVWDINGTSVSITEKVNVMQNWTSPGVFTSSPVSALTSCIYANDLFVVVCIDAVLISSTGNSPWTKANTNIFGSDRNCIAYGNGMFVLVGQTGGTAASTTSIDGTTWTTPVTIPAGLFYTVTYTDNKFIATASTGSSRYVYSSTDGTTWTQDSINMANWGECVAYYNGVLFMFGTYGNSTLMSTDEGTTWQAAKVGSTNLGYIKWITYGNELFVAISTNAIYTSIDGLNWQHALTPSFHLNGSLFYGNGLFVIPDDYTGKIYTSPDGINWTPQKAPHMQYFNSGLYGNHKFIVYVSGSNQFSSSDVTYSGELDTYTYSNNTNNGDIYNISVGEVYTTWSPHTLTYHYPAYMDTFMNVAEYKGILPTPTGVQTIITQI